MQNSLRKAAVVLTIAATVIVTILRVVLAPQMLNTNTGLFQISYVVIGVLLATMIAVFVLVLLGKQKLPAALELEKKSRARIAYSGMFFGSILFVSTLFDCWRWLYFGKTPAPNEKVINNLDGITLFLTIVFGVITALFLIWMGINLVSGRLKRSSSLSLAALSPVVWIWIRLVRYEVSYASAIQVAQSFYDFVMLIFTMLFIFSFARYISGTGMRSPRMLLIYSLCTVLMTITGTATGMILYASMEAQGFQTSHLAGFADFGAGVFALFVALSLAFSKRQPSEEKPEVSVQKDTTEDSAGNSELQSGEM